MLLLLDIRQAMAVHKLNLSEIKESKLLGNVRLMTDESQWPEYIRRLSRSAAEAGRDAIRRLHAAGIPAVFERDGKIIESYPDGHEEVLPETKYKKD